MGRRKGLHLHSGQPSRKLTHLDAVALGPQFILSMAEGRSVRDADTVIYFILLFTKWGGTVAWAETTTV